MLVKLTDHSTGEDMYIDCRNVRIVQKKIYDERSPSKKRGEETVIAVADERPKAQTFLMTYTMLPSGFQAFNIMEDVEEVVRRVNLAWRSVDPNMN